MLDSVLIAASFFPQKIPPVIFSIFEPSPAISSAEISPTNSPPLISVIFAPFLRSTAT
jgi:hypothetical protein